MSVKRLTPADHARAAREPRTSATVNAALAVRGFRAPAFSLTIVILKALPEDKYRGALKLLGMVRRHLSDNLGIDSPTPLILPWARSLSAIDFERLIASERGMQEIFRRCIKIEGMSGPKVDLSLAPWIFQNFVASSPQS